MFSETEFERLYRMPRATYEILGSAVRKADEYFIQNSDALGVRGATTDQKITAALRQLSPVIYADAAVEHTILKESTDAECLKRFVCAVVKECEED